MQCDSRDKGSELILLTADVIIVILTTAFYSCPFSDPFIQLSTKGNLHKWYHFTPLFTKIPHQLLITLKVNPNSV